MKYKKLKGFKNRLNNLCKEFGCCIDYDFSGNKVYKCRIHQQTPRDRHLYLEFEIVKNSKGGWLANIRSAYEQTRYWRPTSLIDSDDNLPKTISLDSYERNLLPSQIIDEFKKLIVLARFETEIQKLDFVEGGVV
jgi:hypothetical protein